MLTPFDDTLWHQLPTGFNHVGTSDPRFFDRYWFAVYAPDGAGALQLTLGAYSNMNVVDCGFVYIDGTKQHNLRGSRALRPKFEAKCGPVGVEVIEPLSRFKLSVEEGDYPVHGVLDWTAVSPPEEEKPHFMRRTGRVVEEYQRFNQIGQVNGWLSVNGKRVDIKDWWSCRDHSWGVRPDMGMPEPITQPEEERAKDTFFSFLFFSTNTLAGHVQVMEIGETYKYITGLIRDRASGNERRVVTNEIAIDFHPGTRRFRAAKFNIRFDNGSDLTLDLDATGPSIAMPGLGYAGRSRGFSGGWNDGQGLGAWRGVSHLETETWDVSHPADVIWPDGSVHRPGHRIQPVRVRASDGSHGNGSLTQLATGVLPRYGLMERVAS